MRTKTALAAVATFLGVVTALPASGASGMTPTAQAQKDDPVRIIVDTDFGHTWDDAAALAVVNAAEDQGVAKLLGVMIDIPNSDAAAAADTIDTYYGHGEIPVGRLSDYQQVYSSFLAHNYKHSSNTNQKQLPDATTLYRELLAKQPDHSVTVVSIGLMDNLAALLASGPDGNSPLSGHDLVAKKVNQLVVMGGAYPSGREYNLYAHPTESAAVVDGWPTPAVFDGHEIGTRMHTGIDICARTPRSNPMAGLYGYLFGCGNDPQPNQLGGSFDATAMYYAVYGTDGIFEHGGAGGSNHVLPDGSNEWVTDGTTDQRYLVPTVSKAEIAHKINSVLYYVPQNRR